MAIAFVDSTAAYIDNSSDTVIVPTGSTGDTMVLCVFLRDASRTVTTPSGWTAVTGNGSINGDMACYVFTKVRGSSESNFTVNFSSSGQSAWSVGCWSGVHADIFSDSARAGANQETDGTEDTGTVTNGTNGWIGAFLGVRNVATIGVISGYTERENVSQAMSIALCDSNTTVAAGSVGPLVWTQDTVNHTASFLFSLKEAGGGGGDPEGRLVGGKLVGGGLLISGVLA